jgi:hypothetical protein
MLDAKFSCIQSIMIQRLEKITHALQVALTRRLSVDYLGADEVCLIFKNVKERAEELNCQLLITQHSDLYQIETSMLFDGDDAHLLLHVPMVPRHVLLRLFRLQPFPLPFIQGQHLIPDVRNDVLAISSTDTLYNIQLSAQDLLSCHRINQVFMCSNFGVMSKKFENTCLGSLYMQRFNEAQHLCKFEIAPSEEKIFQLQKNWFALFLPNSFTVLQNAAMALLMKFI